MGEEEQDGSGCAQDVSVVTLVIKCPNESKDFTIQMPIEASVLAIKQRLQRDYTGSPDPARQRLIVAGSLLADSATIKTIFKDKNLEEPQVMHLGLRQLPPDASAATTSTSAQPSASTVTSGPTTSTSTAQSTATGQITATGTGQSTDVGAGQSTDTSAGQSTGTGAGQSTATGAGQSAATGTGAANASSSSASPSDSQPSPSASTSPSSLSGFSAIPPAPAFRPAPAPPPPPPRETADPVMARIERFGETFEMIMRQRGLDPNNLPAIPRHPNAYRRPTGTGTGTGIAEPTAFPQPPPLGAEAAAAPAGDAAAAVGGGAMNVDAFNQAFLQMMYGGVMTPYGIHPAYAAYMGAPLLPPLYPGLFPPWMPPPMYAPFGPPPGEPQQTPAAPAAEESGSQATTTTTTGPAGANGAAGGAGAPMGGIIPPEAFGMYPMPFQMPYGVPLHMPPPPAPFQPPPEEVAMLLQGWQMVPPAGVAPQAAAPAQEVVQRPAEAVGLRQRHQQPQAAVQPAAPNAVGARQAAPNRRQIVWHFRLNLRLDLMLILKLAIVVFVFNQDSTGHGASRGWGKRSPHRLTFFITMAVLVYLYQTGALAPLVRWMRASSDRLMRLLQFQPMAAQPRGPGAGGAGVGVQRQPGEAGAVGQAQGQGPRGDGNVAVENVGAAQAQVIPPWLSIFRQVFMFILGFFTSLLPGFQGPDADPIAPVVAPAAPVVQQRADGGAAGGDDHPHED